MRKKTVKCLCDNIFWYLIYLLPLILLFGVTFQTGVFTTLSSAMNSVGLNVLTDNVILNSLTQIFGQNGILPLLNNDILVYLTYFVSVFIMHLAIDFLLFIPRLAMKWQDDLFNKGDE